MIGQLLRQLGLLSLLCYQIGCFVISSEQKVIGTYELKVNSTNLTLDIFSNHTFIETVRESGLETKRVSGHWAWTGALAIDSLYIPRSIVPQELSKLSTYSESDHSVFWPEWHFGTVILPIFPDENINFRMIRTR